MKHRNYITDKKFISLTIKIGKNFLGDTAIYAVAPSGKKKILFTINKDRMMSRVSFKRGENKEFGFRVNRKGYIKEE